MELNYRAIDRALHRLAFMTPAVQLSLRDVEELLYASSFGDVSGARPIFVTSLPRAGTTLMLEALHRFPSLAAHVYRDMPFLLAPVLWSRFSGAFRKPSTLRERAHGDGMKIGYDSPEAFEEVLWQAFWPAKYGETEIQLWTAADAGSEAQAFFRTHMRKIIALRRPDRPRDGRYVSKNNANMARVELIPAMFPDATIVVLVRRPLDQARSLLTQHQRFLAIHRETPFAQRYMADIGHYEFGLLHRPFAFPGFDELSAGHTPVDLNYWLAYWITAFENILARRKELIVVSYEECCRHPVETLTRLCSRLDVSADGVLDSAALFRPERILPPPPAVDPSLAERAARLHAVLLETG